MKVADLKFEATDCCGEHHKAIVEHGDVKTMIAKTGEGLYSITVTNSKGLVSREVNCTEERVNDFLALIGG